jgi:hypothetical protein
MLALLNGHAIPGINVVADAQGIADDYIQVGLDE